MKKLWFGILATLLLAVFVAPAFAWDFSTMGQFEWRYRYIGRANGYQDLFGDMRLQDNPLLTFPAGTGPIGFAGPNFWRGYNGPNGGAMTTASWGSSVKVVRAGFAFADADASEYDQRMTFLPEIRINNAIRLRGNIDLASIRQKYNHRDMVTNGPMDRWYQDRMSQNAFDTAMIPSVNQWHLTAQLPWGLLSAGARDFPWGPGAVLGYNTRNDSLLFVLPYGPFRIIPQFWLANNPDGFGAFLPYGGIGPLPNTVVNMDNGTHFPVWWSVVATYTNGPVDMGGGFLQRTLHSNNANLVGEGFVGLRPAVYNPGLPPTIYGYGGMDQAILAFTTYLKYNNGRFFANLEYWWGNIDTYFLGYGVLDAHRPAATVSGAPQMYTEGSMAFAELGAMCGPAKLTAMFAWSGGQALNNGNPTKAYSGIAINNQATDPYNYLLFHTYGGGNDAPWNAGIAFTNDENGQMADAWCLAGRLDYAVAANLNIWGSYMWANRVEENGWLAGQKDWNGNVATGATNPLGLWTAADAVAWKNSAMPGAGGNMNPYVDSCYLGWEADMGVDWKLLENMTVCSRYAYWQPGTWFDQAYQVVGLNAGGTVAANAPYGGFMQGRSAIQSFSSSIMIDF
ncbi:MAG: hypothetical protein M0T73_02495 [Deltaproteobacteria bacterium]|nr:hypothetical protein [Deltaproteobacteria bacterium]